MRVIRIDDEVWQALQSMGKPFEDTPNDVLRRLLKLDGAPPQPPGPPGQRFVKVQKGSRELGGLPTSEFEVPILKVLERCGGSDRREEVLQRLEPEVRPLLKRVDYGVLRSGEIRWRKKADSARHTMVQQGLLLRNSPRGVWEISAEGKHFLQQPQRYK